MTATVIAGEVVFETVLSGQAAAGAERRSQQRTLAVEERLRDIGFRRDAVETVECAVDHHDLARHAGGPQPLGVGEVLVVEEVECPDADPRRRQPGEVGAARGYGDIRIGVTQIGTPAELDCSTGSTAGARGCRGRCAARCGRRSSDTREAVRPSAISPRSRVSSASAAARPPPALAPPMATRAGSTAGSPLSQVNAE